MPPVNDESSSSSPKSSIFLKATGLIAGSVLLIFLLFLTCMGVAFFLEIPFRLVFGWGFFLNDKLPQIRPDWSALVIGVLAYFISRP
ncbi:MAG TPA: hypothetical protein DIW81_01575 [Planctomycetaceae bacterium]|nr:hypothetical protein [Rubinisphaera sp.]HCS50276.1 hypothetical protein [Planctomycetaceae bacterium]